MIRVLNVTEVFQAAGIESFIMNMYRHLDRSKVQFDFFVMSRDKEIYDDELKELGARKYGVKVEEKNTLKRIIIESKYLYEFLKKHHYDIVHIHYTTPLRAFYLLAAKKAGCKVRIYHSHSAFVSGKGKLKRSIYQVLRGRITNWATDYFACSKAAAKWMFADDIITNNQYQVIYNGIDCEQFSYDEEKRKKIRDELALKDAYTIVHTGRFLEQKNHQFLIEVFALLKQKQANAKLLLLGVGELQSEMKALVKKLQLDDDVLFLNVRKDVDAILSAGDCYVMPSLYEGLPVSGIEAQCADLPCVFSDEITKETQVIDRVCFLSLNDDKNKWVEQILAYQGMNRRNVSKMIKSHGYDINEGAKQLQEFYLEASRREVE